MKRLFLLMALLLGLGAKGQSDIIISQYIETSVGSSPKGIEIANVSGNDIFLSPANRIQIFIGSNGTSCTSIVNVSTGVLLANEVWVIGTSDLENYALANGTGISGATDYSFTFNGDDAIQVRLGGVIQDTFGMCGNDPMGSWFGGGVDTEGFNLQILDGICDGEPGGWIDPSIRFQSIASGQDLIGFGNPPPQCFNSDITVFPTSVTGLNYFVGNGPSTEQPFTFNATNFMPFSDITIMAPPNFEISDQSDAINYESLIIVPTDGFGNLMSQNYYVRLAAGLPAGFYGPQNITLTGNGAMPVDIGVAGIVSEPVVTFSEVSSTTTETGMTSVLLVESDVAGPHSVTIGAIGGTATPGVEFNDPLQTINFNGLTAQTIEIQINDNTTCDGDVNAIFSLFNPVNCIISPIDLHDLTITDDEVTQTIIDFQGFEGTGWPFVSDPPAYSNATNNWSAINVLGPLNEVLPANGANFWGIEDLNNTNHTLTFTEDISTFSDVQVGFKWHVEGFNNSDFLAYEIIWDGVSQGITTICAGGSCNPVTWSEITENIPNSVSVVDLVLIANSDGEDEHAGFDDVFIAGLGCNNCFEPTTNSSFLPTSPSAVTTTTASIDWDNVGDGDNSILVMRQGTGLGGQTGTNDNVVFIGSANSATITDLVPGTEYVTEVYDFNCIVGSGEENYLTNSPDLDIFVTKPVEPDNLDVLCVTNSEVILQWPVPTDGVYDGYLIVASQGNTPSPTLFSNGPDAYAPNTSWPSADIYDAGSNSRVLYKGPNNTINVSDLPIGQSFTFQVYTYVYTSDGLEYEYSANSEVTQVIEQSNVLDAAGTPGNGAASLSWNLPGVLCFDEVLVVATTAPGIGFNPSGTTYIGDPNYTTPNQVVYFDSANNFVTVTGLNNGTTYYFEIFVLNGTEWSSGIEVAVTPTMATVLERGDIAIVGVNSVVTGDEDDIYLAFFKEITTNTAIDFTDNGYERAVAGLWGDSEGVIRITYIGASPLTAGEIIRIKVPNNSASNIGSFVIEMDCMDVSGDWSVTSLNGGNDFALNENDQLWVMQSGNWVNGGMTNQSNYTGNILYGWSASGWQVAPNWSGGGSAGESGSTIPIGLNCFTTDLSFSSNGRRGKYIGITSPTDKRTWIGRINSTANWSVYANDANYSGPTTPDFCNIFGVTGSGFVDGSWAGTNSTNWFDCNNWGDLRVPNQTTDVQINATTFDPVIDPIATFASVYNGVAETGTLNLTTSLSLAAGGDLDIYDDLNIIGSGNLLTQNSGDIEVFGNFQILSAPGKLDLSSSNPSTFTLHGNWNVVTDASNATGFIQDNSAVFFAGANDQNLFNSIGLETFHDFTINKIPGTRISLQGSDLEIDNTGTLTFGIGGFVDAISDNRRVTVLNASTSSIAGYQLFNGAGVYDNDKFIAGALNREITNGSYDFPIGDLPSGLSMNPVNLNATVGVGGLVSAIFNPVSPGIMDVYDNTLLCGSTQRILNYDDFAGNGFWNLSGPSGVSYDITLHPNFDTNSPIHPSITNEYRILKAPSGTGGPGNPWPTASVYYPLDICTPTSYFSATSSYTDFSDFAIMPDILDPVISLPIELLNFSARVQEQDVAINWSTAVEIENDYFNVYHSLDGENWEVIDQQSGAGNSQEIVHYASIHKNPKVGVHYYQLQQVDFNGNHSFSEVEAVDIGLDADLKIYPIPADQKLFLESRFPMDENSILVFNDQGQSMGNWSFENGILNIDRFAPGVYFIRLTTLDNSVVKKFIKSGSE